MPRIKLVLNPSADRGRAGHDADMLRSLIDRAAATYADPSDPCQLDWVETARPGHATELAQQAAEQGYDIVTAIGGDGTAHEIVNGLMRVEARHRPALAIVPAGSGNDLAYNLGLPQAIDEAIKQLFCGTSRAVDVGSIVDGTGRTEYWANIVGIGFDGAVNIATRKLSHIRGFLLYLTGVLQTIIVNYDAPLMRVHIDGQTIFEKRVTMFTIGNGPREGGGFQIAPDAQMDDGLLDWVCARRVGRLMMLRLLPEVMAARHLSWPQFSHGQARHMTIDADRRMPIHADGEVFGSWEADIRHLEVDVLPATLRVLC